MIRHTRQQLLILWTIWFSLVVAIVVYQFALGGGIPTGANAPVENQSLFVFVSAGLLLAASAIRWLLIPRADAPGKILVLMIMGLSFSEAVGLFGLLLIPMDQPGTKLALWVLSLASALQFMPVYARRDSQQNPFHTS
jgi:NADH:ubiquinone oxidoreductase subunit K